MSEKKCIFCSKIGQSLLNCSACGTVSYCNQTCQKSDWKKHKKNCRAFKVVAIEGKGYGMVAVRTIRQGEIILTENPLLILNKSKKERDKGPSLQEQFTNLSESNKAKVLKLHHENPEGTLEEKIKGIFESNTIEVTPVNSIALYPTIPRINHSCSPSVVWSWVEGNPWAKQVRAVRDIQPEEELCANYIDSFEATFSPCSVRQELLQRWHFLCRCQVCSLQGDCRQKNDVIREKISLQHKLIPKYMAGWKIDKAVAAARTKVELMKSIQEQMITTLPSAKLELYEMCRLAKTLGCSVPENCDDILQEARDMSVKLGDRFLHVFHQKVEQVEQECREVCKSQGIF